MGGGGGGRSKVEGAALLNTSPSEAPPSKPRLPFEPTLQASFPFEAPPFEPSQPPAPSRPPPLRKPSLRTSTKSPFTKGLVPHLGQAHSNPEP